MKIKTGKIKAIAGTAAVAATLLACPAGHAESITTADRPATSAAPTAYVTSRAPLASAAFIKLPTGSIKPTGWLLHTLNLQADGLCGRLGEISAWLEKDGNAWLASGGKWGWEEVPYWLRGYSSMAWILGREDMQRESKFWIDAIIKGQ